MLVAADVGELNKLYDLGLTSWLPSESVANGVYYGPVTFFRESQPYMTLAVASPQSDVIVAEVNLKFIWDVVSRIKIGEKGKAYVVDGNGFLVADPDIGLETLPLGGMLC